MPLTREEIAQIATRTADEVMDRISLEREERELRDHIIGGAMGEGAIPLYGRETRKEPCHGCRIDPGKPLEAGNVMATTNNAIGTLAPDEVRNWCSEIIEVTDGRCQRARAIKEAARVCKEKYPEDTAKFFECYAPAFSKITKRSNPETKYLARLDPALATRASEQKVFDSPDEAIAYAETLKAKMLPGDVVHVREGIGFEYKVIFRYQMP